MNIYPPNKGASIKFPYFTSILKTWLLKMPLESVKNGRFRKDGRFVCWTCFILKRTSEMLTKWLVSASFFQVTLWYPKWRSLNPWKGHLKLPKRSLGRTWCSFFSGLGTASDWKYEHPVLAWCLDRCEGQFPTQMRNMSFRRSPSFANSICRHRQQECHFQKDVPNFLGIVSRLIVLFLCGRTHI